MELGAGVCCQGTVPNIKVYASCIVDEEWDCRKRPAEIHKPGGSSPSKYGSYPLNRRHSSRSASRSTTPGTRFLSTRRKSVRPLTAWRTLRWISSSPFVASTYRPELGGDHHDRLHPLRTTRRLVERLAGLGFEVELRPKEPAVQEVQPETSVPRKRSRPKGSKNRHPTPGAIQPQASLVPSVPLAESPAYINRPALQRTPPRIAASAPRGVFPPASTQRISSRRPQIGLPLKIQQSEGDPFSKDYRATPSRELNAWSTTRKTTVVDSHYCRDSALSVDSVDVFGWILFVRVAGQSLCGKG